jgi:CRISPR-associated protein Cas5d
MSNRHDPEEYVVKLEVAGPAAMFARPDTGSTPISYPAPTWSAAKGIFESIAFFADGNAWICPTKIEVCRKIGETGGSVRYQRYSTNYGGPLRKDSLRARGAAPGGSSMQLFGTILTDVAFRIHGAVLGKRTTNGKNPKHHLQDLFNRRLERGQCFHTPCLGWSEFTCSYWGLFRDGSDGNSPVTEVDNHLTLEVPSMLLAVWDRPTVGQHYLPTYCQQVKIMSGVLTYDVPTDWQQLERRNYAQ